MKNVVFIYMNNALKYTITNKIRFNLKEIEKLKSSFLEAVLCPKWIKYLGKKKSYFYNPIMQNRSYTKHLHEFLSEFDDLLVALMSAWRFVINYDFLSRATR